MADQQHPAVAWDLVAGVDDDAVLGRHHRRAFGGTDVDAVVAGAVGLAAEGAGDLAPDRPQEAVARKRRRRRARRRPGWPRAFRAGSVLRRRGPRLGLQGRDLTGHRAQLRRRQVADRHRRTRSVHGSAIADRLCAVRGARRRAMSGPARHRQDRAASIPFSRASAESAVPIAYRQLRKGLAGDRSGGGRRAGQAGYRRARCAAAPAAQLPRPFQSTGWYVCTQPDRAGPGRSNQCAPGRSPIEQLAAKTTDAITTRSRKHGPC